MITLRELTPEDFPFLTTLRESHRGILRHPDRPFDHIEPGHWAVLCDGELIGYGGIRADGELSWLVSEHIMDAIVVTVLLENRDGSVWAEVYATTAFTWRLHILLKCGFELYGLTSNRIQLRLQ